MANWALVVGINVYPAAKGVNPLAGAVADAADFAEWALHEFGGAVPHERLYFWGHPWPAQTGPLLAQYDLAPTHWVANGEFPPDQTRPPTKSEIHHTVFTMAKAAEQQKLATGEPQKCFVFLAGHGALGSIEAYGEAKTCFMAGDYFDSPLMEGLLPIDQLRTGMLSHGFDEVHFFLDCCRVSAFRANDVVPPVRFPAKQYPKTARWTAGHAADRDNGIAFETPIANPSRGAFSKVLIEGMRRLRNADGALVARNLEEYVRARIGPAVFPRKQSPYFTGEPDTSEHRLAVGPPIPLDTADVTIDFSRVAVGENVVIKNSAGLVLQRMIRSQQAEVVVSLEIGQMYAIETEDRKHGESFLHTAGVSRNVVL